MRGVEEGRQNKEVLAEADGDGGTDGCCEMESIRSVSKKNQT